LHPEAVRVQLARIVQSRTFSNAPTLRRLLDYLVDRSLQGSADRLKEYVLGVEVFDRFDMMEPERLPPAARMARRLMLAVPPLRFAGHVVTTYCALWCVKQPGFCLPPVPATFSSAASREP
jgi:hypothetical protein